MTIMGIDPGTGLSSPAAMFVYDSNSFRIIHYEKFTSKKKDATCRIREIALNIADRISYFKPDLFCIENFVMRGKGGETLQRFIGSLIPFTKEEIPFLQIQNTTVKKVVGGSGKAEKLQVAEGVLEYFTGSLTIKKLLEEEQWDILDAAAIAISGNKKWKEK